MTKTTRLVIALGMMISGAMAVAAPKVLYFTHEPGRWHKYTPQLAAFKKLAEAQDWELTVSTGSYDQQIKNLQTPDYAKGYDVVVYNFCFAASNDLDACSNLMHQTRELGVPAVLMHCSMHSWWSTFKNGNAAIPDYDGKAKANKKVLDAWTAKNPDKPFPVWGDFTGIASTGHGPQLPIALEKVADHAACNSLPEGAETPNAELYNNYYVTDAVTPLIKGTQTKGNNKTEAIVMWQVPQGKSQVIGLSLGHGMPEWDMKVFQDLVTDTVNYLAKNPKPAE